MLCDVCLAIDFRPLNEWKHRAYDIHDPSNGAFRFVEPNSFDESNISQWRMAGQGNVYGYYFHHESGVVMLDSARNGCYLCAAMAFALFAESVILSAPVSDLQTLSTKQQPVILRMTLSAACSTWRDDTDHKRIRLHCEAREAWLDVSTVRNGNPLDDTYIGLCRELEAAWEWNDLEPYVSTWSKSNLQLATKWHEECLANHETCRVGKSLLPKRVIDVGSTRDFQPILIEPVVPTYADYVILSHCWGAGKPVLPTKSDKDSATWSLPPLSEWEQTFQDAVEVARSLHVRYLWIDAPCILQGPANVLDWATESVKMAQYFQNATVCVCASKARSGADGLFTLRNPLLTYPCHLRLPAAGNLPAFERFVHPSRGDLLTHGEVEPNLTDSPPSARAWCLQEAVLSPRMLSFGHKRLYWRCFSVSLSESRISQPQGTSLGTDAAVQDAKDLKMHMQVPAYPPEWRKHRNPYYDAWYIFIRQFNIRHIAYHNDVLPAISGVAELLHSHLDNDKYLVGLWQRDIVVGLLWIVTNPNIGKVRPPESFNRSHLYAPSWSWISQAHMDIFLGAFKYLGDHPNESLAQLVSHEIRLKDKMLPFGLVDLGMLVFQTQLPRVTVTPGVPRKSPFYDSFFLSTQSADQPCPVTRMEMHPNEWDLQPVSSSSKFWPWVSRYQLVGQCYLDDREPRSRAQRSQRQKRSLVTRFIDAFVSRPFGTVDGFFLPLKADQAEYGRFRTMGLVLVKAVAPQGCGGGEYYRRIGCGKFNLGPGAWKACSLSPKKVRLI